MAVISVPKDLDRVNKSLVWFGQSTNCLHDFVVLCYFHEKTTCLCDVVGSSKMDCRIVL